ncbi:MAG: hypothetical protein AMS14_11410 [Planctomycetes bacterium DG_20]|nr:MAG: hypothetical protein AMS14_11410 [Planctomycetes bacterium DG_20]
MGAKGEESDDGLMRAFQRGDVGAFETLVRRYHAPLTAFTESLTGDPSEADDVVQMTFVKVYEHYRDYIPMGRFRAWIYAVARNLCMDTLRQPRPASLDLDMPLVLWSGTRGYVERTSNEAWAERSAQLNQIRRAADRLPAAMKEAVELKYVHGLKAREIAEVQKCPVGTVKSRLHRALQRLGQMVGSRGPRNPRAPG